MSTVRDVAIGGAGATAAVWCARWARDLAGHGAGTVDELVAVLAAALTATLAAWYAATAVVLVAARATSRRSTGTVAATLGRLAGRWGAPLLRRTATAAAGAGLVLGAPPAWAAAPETPPAPVERVEGIPLDLRPGLGPAPAPSVEPVAHQSPAEPAHSTYVVEPGDSLWSISAASLGAAATDAQIAAEWPRWYHANRAVVGADPDLIHPGQELLAPEPKDTP